MHALQHSPCLQGVSMPARRPETPAGIVMRGSDGQAAATTQTPDISSEWRNDIGSGQGDSRLPVEVDRDRSP
jgi:hypothetical protein